MAELATLQRRRSLADLERTIAAGLDTFLAVGEALLEIQADHRYREAGYPTFTAYLAERWPQYSRRQLYNAIAAAGVHETVGDVGLPSGHLVELARLPLREQREMAAIAAARSLTVRQLRALIREKQALRPPRPLPSAVPYGPIGPLPDGVEPVQLGDARDLPLDAGSVDHVITSPPYGVGLDKLGYVDYADQDEYRELMGASARELFRVLRDGGRVALNVPVDTATHEPVGHHWTAAMLAAGFRHRSTAVWREGNISYSPARGTIDGPRAINLICPDELLIVFHKGEWRLSWDGLSDLAHDEWLSWPLASWTFDGESKSYGGYPACFPLELPRRLLKLLTYRGDLVLDPFCGTATTGAAAVQLGRRFVGFDVNPEAVRLARARLSEVC